MESQKFFINDIPVFLTKTDKFKTINIQFVFLYDFSKELATKLSLLIRLLNSSTKLYNTKKKLVNKLYDLYDASIGVSFSPSYKTSIISFELEIVNEKNISDKSLYDESFAFLKEIILNPNIIDNHFSEKEFLEEKRKLKEAILKIYNNKNRYAIRKMIKLMCADEVASVSFLGEIDDLEKITSYDLVSLYNDLMHNSNISIYVVGDIEKTNIEKHLKSFNLFQGRELVFEFDSEEKHPVNKIKEEKEIQSLNQSILCMGFRTDFNANHPLFYSSLVFCEMFGGGYTSDLFRIVREENSFAYNIVAQMISDIKLMIVDAGIDSKNYDNVKKMVVEVLKEYQKGNIDSDLLEVSKTSLINETLEIEDEPKAYISFMLKNYILKKYITINDIIESINKTTIEDITKISQGIYLDTIFLLSNE